MVEITWEKTSQRSQDTAQPLEKAGSYRGRREGSEANGEDPVGPLVGHQVKLPVQLAHGDRLRVQDRYLDLVFFHKSLREREEPT